MSIHLTSAVWNHSKQQKAGALVVLLAIADYANAVSVLRQRRGKNADADERNDFWKPHHKIEDY